VFSEFRLTFSDLQLLAPLLRSVASEGYNHPTPIQAQTIPHILSGRDVLGCAQTGTGKTAAFALPILHRLMSAKPAHGKTPLPRCLVLCPTRELATQIADAFKTYGQHTPIRGAVVFGGVSQHHQVNNLRRGVDVIVATPGRLLDLMNQGHIDLRGIQTLVLDEADRMLDMGFINDIRKIVAKVPSQRQTLLFSATMPHEIRSLASSLLRDPVSIQIEPEKPAAQRVEQTVYFAQRTQKPDLLAQLVQDLGMSRVIVFTRTKHGADRLVRQLHQRNIRGEAIHGNKTQNARQRALDNFRKDKVGILVATDIAARGIDVDGVTHVVNYDLTHEPETYVHRIGRTARAGAAGMAISLCDRDEIPHLRAIERLLRQSIPVSGPAPDFSTAGHSESPRPTRSASSNGSHSPHAKRGRTRAPFNPAHRKAQPGRGQHGGQNGHHAQRGNTDHAAPAKRGRARG
jgi:ATP-dependent RNA helicase RhlE